MIIASLFLYKSMWQYLLFGVLSVIATLIFLFVPFKEKRTGVCMTGVDICVAIWCIWLLLYLCLFPCEHYHLVFLLTSGLLFFALRGLMNYERGRRLLRPLVELMASYVVIVCILQLLGIIKSENSLFNVTGPHENPNVTAMFLALCLPVLLFEKRRERLSWLCWVTICGGIICVLLLQCRTAWIGMAITLLLYLWNQDKVRVWFSFQCRKRKGLLFVFLSIFVVFTSVGMYRMKKASADGRLFIWKVALSQLKETSWKGNGYGLFEVYYNKYQNKYLATHDVSSDETTHARYVFMPYSEWLENALSGGIPGNVLFALLLIVPLCRAIKKKNLLYICVFSNTVWFASVNYLTRAIPVWGMFILCMASWSNKDYSIELRGRWVCPVCKMVFLVWMCISSYSYVRKGVAQYQLKRSVEVFAHHPQHALDVMQKYYSWASTSECYLRYYGQMLLACGHYGEAEKILSEALCFTYNSRTLDDYERAHLLKEQGESVGKEE